LELLGVQQRRSNFAVRPQAADAAIAALVAGTPPAAWISMAVMRIEGYNRYMSGYLWISMDIGRINDLDIKRIS
jgi:hypothetical protein